LFNKLHVVWKIRALIIEITVCALLEVFIFSPLFMGV